MLTLLRTRAAFWAGAGILAMAGAATSLAAAGLNQPEEDAPSEAPPSLVAAEQPAPADASLDGAPPAEGTGGDAEAAVADGSAVRGVPEDSPACENVGCGEVENAGGVTLHLPQPAVDGITRAAENREAARNKGEDEEDEGEEPAADEAPVDEGSEASTEDAVRGVPEDSPACENVGCGEVTNPGGVTLHLPQPAVDGMNKAAENRAAAHDKENGGVNASANGNNGKGKGKP